MAHQSAFLGRTKELDELMVLLQQFSIISIVGPFGAGKTRLSQALIENIDNSLFFDLSEVKDYESAVRKIADVLEIRLKHEDELGQIGRFIATKNSSIVVLDNAEQILDFVRESVQRWNEIAPKTTFVITTRERLQLPTEGLLYLSGLNSEFASTLFVDRALQVDPMFMVNSQSMKVIENLVNLLDRLPLLIELVASRMDIFSLRDLSENISTYLTSIRTRDHSRSERQATVLGAIDWSWELLSSKEKDILSWASLFHGSFSLRSLQSVSNILDAPTLIGNLLEKSLLKKVPSHSDPLSHRFSLYESVRIYMMQKKRPKINSYTCYWAEQAKFLYKDFPKTRKKLDDELRDDFENYLCALENADGKDLIVLARVLDAFLEWRSPQSLRERVLEIAQKEDALKGRVSLFHLRAGNLYLAENMLSESKDLEMQYARFLFAMFTHLPECAEIFAEIAEQKAQTPRQFELVALAYAAEGTRIASHSHLKKARQLAKQTKDDLTIAKVLNAEGAFHTKQGDVGEALGMYERAMNLLKPGSPMRDTIAGNIALIAHYKGNLDRAIQAYSEVENSLQHAGLTKEAAIFSANRATVLIESGRLEEAEDTLADAEFILQQFEIGPLTTICISKANIAHLRFELDLAEKLYLAVQSDSKIKSVQTTAFLALLYLQQGEEKKTKKCITDWTWEIDPLWDTAMKLLAQKMNIPTPEINPHIPVFVKISLDYFNEGTQPKHDWIFTQLFRQLTPSRQKQKIIVSKDGAFVTINGTSIDLSRRGPAKKLLAFLVEEHLKNPTSCFDLDALFEAGWPGINIDFESAHKRVYAAIGTLRRQGLEDLIQTTDEGYRIHPDLEICRP